MKIVLDPGHSGPFEPGACAGGFTEAEIVLSIARRTCRRLLAAGHAVRLTRSGNIADADLAWRSDLANRWGADLFISIHANSAENPSAHGSEIWRYPGSAAGASLGRSLLRWVVLLTIADIVLAFLNFLWGIFLGLWLGNSGLDTAGIQLFMTVTSSAWTALFVLITLTVLVLIALSWRAASRAARGGMVLICAMLAARWLYSAAMSVVVIPALVRSGIPPTTFRLWLTVAGVSWLLVSTALLAFGAYRTHRGGAAA